MVVSVAPRRLRQTGKPYGFLIIFHPVPDYKILEDLCRKVYFPVEPVSLGEITLLNALLHPVLSELKRFAHPGISIEEAEKWEGVCGQNLKRGVESYEVNVIPTYEHALLLSIAVCHTYTFFNNSKVIESRFFRPKLIIFRH